MAMRALRILLASSLIALSLLAAPASATSYSTDQSDLYYIPSESGWGIQLVQRGDTIFATLFVYDGAGNPIWYVGTLYAVGLVWSGSIYLTTGPYFGAMAYNPALFGGRVVGTMKWMPTTITEGILTYSVDGVEVRKDITRQTLVSDNYNGRYGGGVHQDRTQCFNALNNGIVENVAVLGVNQNGTAVSMSTEAAAGPSCSYVGTLLQSGQMGSITGNYNCTDGDFGAFGLIEVTVTLWAISGRLLATSTPSGCHSTGWFGGARTTTF
jgi:hypothetical protein